jgi:hypothetical protein
LLSPSLEEDEKEYIQRLAEENAAEETADLPQDFFQLGLVPADTDYRMFSASMQGSLPGIDTAFLLGAGMYHTDRDSIENIRPGTVQVTPTFPAPCFVIFLP